MDGRGVNPSSGAEAGPLDEHQAGYCRLQLGLQATKKTAKSHYNLKNYTRPLPTIKIHSIYAASSIKKRDLTTEAEQQTCCPIRKSINNVKRIFFGK